jgi:hypothetical protein
MCRLCDHFPEVARWMTRSLRKNQREKNPPWPLKTLARHAMKAYGVHFSYTLAERHLEQHEPLWKIERAR